jgi:predicted secreted hydrolase
VLATLMLALACGPAGREDAAPSIRFASGERPAFARVLDAPTLEFPRDHGPHYDHQTEWWYYTGHLEAADGRRFGYQLTFFRRGLSPGPPPDGPGLATNQFHFAHFAVTDVGAGRYRFSERSSRGAAALAGAHGTPFRVWLDGWEARATDAKGREQQLTAMDGGIGLELQLRARKPLVAHGDGGLSPKSMSPGNASVYLSYTRLETQGTLDLDGETLAVTGESWFDHEWSTSALGQGAVGWDWFSLQLDDGRELMLFQIRRGDGGVEPVSAGTLVQPDGSPRRLARDAFAVEVLEHWQSPHTGARYPSAWRVQVPSAGLDLRIHPVLRDQELRASFEYWEGAVDVTGTATGRGYVELTGYATSLAGVF